MTKGWLNDDFDVPGDLSVTGDIVNTAIRLKSGYVENLGITYSAGTFTVRGGAATLSATNPAYACMSSSSAPGSLILYTETADQNFIDDAGASQIINNLFGFPTGVAVTTDVRFYMYLVSNDAEDAVAVMICRMSHLTESPATVNIGAPDDAVADKVGDFWSFDNIDETLYDTNPCICIGSFRMQMSSSDDWTVQTLDSTDGIGVNCDRNNFKPKCRATLGSDANNVTGDNTKYTILWQTEQTNSPEYSAATGTYTAPRDGIYMVTTSIRVVAATSNATQVNLAINTTDDYEMVDRAEFWLTGTGATFQTAHLVQVLKDGTVDVDIRIAGTTKTFDLQAGTDFRSMFAVQWVSEL